MGIRSNKVGGDIKGKRERKCEFLERCLILKSLIKRKKKKRCPREVNLGRHNSTHSFIFFQNQQLGFVSSNPT